MKWIPYAVADRMMLLKLERSSQRSDADSPGGAQVEGSDTFPDMAFLTGALVSLEGRSAGGERIQVLPRPNIRT